MKLNDIHKLVRRLSETSQEADVTISLPMLEIFLLVATTPGINIIDIVELMKVNNSTITLYCQRLGEGERSRYRDGKPIKKPGLGLVKTEIEDDDHRKRRVLLTQKGKELVERLQSI